MSWNTRTVLPLLCVLGVTTGAMRSLSLEAAQDAPGAAKRTPKAAAKDPRETEALKLIDAAHRFLGGRERLYAVKALEIKQSETQTLRLLFPDLYQIENATRYATPMLVSFDGQRMRRKMPAEIAAIGGGTSTAAPDDTMRRRAHHTMAKYALIYLLRTLPIYPVRARSAGTLKIGDTTGPVVELLRMDDSETLFARVQFDARDGRPVAIAEPFGEHRAAPDGELVSTLNDYREVNGIRIAFRVASTRIGQNGSKQVMPEWAHRAIVVDPPLTRETFSVGDAAAR